MIRAARSRPAIWLAAIAAIGLLIALLTAAPPAVTYRSNVVPAEPVPIATAREQCVDLVVIPEETRAVRVTAVTGRPLPSTGRLVPATGAPITLQAPRRVDGGRAIYRLPRAVTATTLGGRLCLQGGPPRAAVAGTTGTPSVDLLGAERGSWIEALPLLSERAGFARAVFGRAALPVALLCLLGAWVLVVRAAPRSAHAPVDRSAVRVVFLVAALVGTSFAVTTPALEAPDEMVHLHYVDLLRDQQSVPRSIERGPLSPQLDELVGASRVGEVAFQPSHRPPWTAAEDAALRARLDALPSGGVQDSFTNASSQPPGYYAVGALLTSVIGGNELDRLLVVRLLSVLLMAFAIAGGVVFARAAVPSAGGLVLVGGLMAATTPLVAFIGASVNPDSAYAAATAWMLAGIATILRQGLTMRRALWVGAAIGLGLASKLTFLPMLAVATAAALVILVREVRARRLRGAVAPMGGAALLAAALGAPFLLWAQFGGRGLVFGAAGDPVGTPASMRELISYAIELYVGQVGPIRDRIPGSGPDIFIGGLSGRLGWLDYGPSDAWGDAFMWLWLALLALALVGVARAFARRRSSVLEFTLWVIAVVPLLLAIASSGFYSRSTGAIGFEQARYLLPLMAIAIAGIGLAVRQLPTRVHAWAAAGLCTVGLLHGTTLWLMTVGRYFA